MKLLTLLLLISITVNGQSLIVNDTFETGTQGWQPCNPATHVNNWVLGTAAGNGTSSAGANAMFITQDGSAYGYGNASLVEEKIVIWKSFNTTGYANGFTLSFDWRGFGDYNTDALYFVICFANPIFINNWSIASSPMCATSGWTTETFIIPSPTYMNNNPNLKIGFMFKYNNSNIYSPAFAIDNFRIIATQSPLSISNTEPNNTTTTVKNNKYKYYNFLGQEINPNGYCIRIDEYGNTKRVMITDQ